MADTGSSFSSSRMAGQNQLMTTPCDIDGPRSAADWPRLRQAGVDLTAGTVTVRRNRVELREGCGAALDAGQKTDAGRA